MVRREYGILLLALNMVVAGEAWSWGSVAHRFINQNATQHLPSALSQLAAQQMFLMNHASDADTRKSSDPTEEPKHFIDLESFSDFHQLPADLSVVIAQYGWSSVETNGILPWTIVTTVDSLTVQFSRGDLTKAYQSAADLGHYVGDAYQPLHCTVNYNGQLTGNSGIHSRYETSMIGQFQSSLSVHPDSVKYVSNVYALALSVVLRSNTYVDSIMQADNAARTASGWNGSGTAPQTYYTALWARTGRLTLEVLQDATEDLASLWYTAWMNARVTDVASAQELSGTPSAFQLDQNYPNPFNPATKIGYTIAGTGHEAPGTRWVKLSVYDMLGREVAVLVDEPMAPGAYTAQFDASGLASGTYFYRLQTTGDGRSFAETKRMMLVR
jgi:hypothetical protein